MTQSAEAILLTDMLAQLRQIGRDTQTILDHPNFDNTLRESCEAALKETQEAAELVAKKLLEVS